MKRISIILLFTCIFSCHKDDIKKVESKIENTTQNQLEENFINKNENVVIGRFSVPENYSRISYSNNEFGYFLQNLKLKKYGSLVNYYNGKQKPINDVYNAVIDLPIGHKDLHQCADATMRLRADYLYQQKRYNEIYFNFLSDGKPRYFTDYAKGNYSDENYWKYLENIFSYANTASLKNQLKTIDYQHIKIGDILIQQGNPYGHAVMIVDLAENKNGEKIVLLAQSYMPAQELQILNNPSNKDSNPWYKVDKGKIKTPEWLFTSDDWKTWN